VLSQNDHIELANLISEAVSAATGGDVSRSFIYTPSIIDAVTVGATASQAVKHFA